MADDPIRLGIEAERLLKDETLAKAFADVEARCIERWRMAKTPEGREKEHSILMAVDLVRTELRAMVDAKTMREAETARFGRNQKH